MVEESHYDLLRDAIFDNDRGRVAELLDCAEVNVDHFDAGGQTLLHLASFWGRMDIVKLLLSAGASMKTKNAAGCTALDLAVHWGHSAVAEVIRLRGGSSVWEDKLGLLQVALEDANLKLADIQVRYDEKNRQCEAKSSDIHALERQLENERGAHTLTTFRLDEAILRLVELESRLFEQQQSIERLTGELQSALVDKANAESARDRAEGETSDLMAHRDEILAKMEESVAKQEESTYNWQRAEVAAAIAETQRNFALSDRDRYQKRYGAALGDLVVMTARLAAAEQELMELKNNLAEYIFEFTKAKRSQKRAAKAMQSLPQSYGGGQQRQGPRAVTAPVHGSSGLPTKQSKTKAVNNTDGFSMYDNSIDISVTHGIVYPKKERFSLAARDFGEKLRAQEKRKQQLRVQELQRVENQFLADGLNLRVAVADHFQEEFVSSVREFSTSHAKRWKELKIERDQQLRFTANAQSRSVCTAPGGSRTSNGLVLDEDKPSMIFSQVQNALVGGGEVGCHAVTSTNRRRLQADFFAVDNAQSDADRLNLEQKPPQPSSHQDRHTRLPSL